MPDHGPGLEHRRGSFKSGRVGCKEERRVDEVGQEEADRPLRTRRCWDVPAQQRWHGLHGGGGEEKLRYRRAHNTLSLFLTASKPKLSWVTDF